MGISLAFNVGVVLAVNGNPLFSHHAGGEPQPKAEKMHDRRVKVDTSVRLTAVQEQSHRHNRDVRETQRDQRHLPPGKLQKAAGQKLKDLVHI